MSPAESATRFSITSGALPGAMVTRSGRPRTGRDGASVSRASASAVGLPQRSSATIASRNGSPATASDGQIAFQRCAGPGTRSMAGCCGSSQNS